MGARGPFSGWPGSVCSEAAPGFCWEPRERLRKRPGFPEASGLCGACPGPTCRRSKPFRHLPKGGDRSSCRLRGHHGDGRQPAAPACFSPHLQPGRPAPAPSPRDQQGCRACLPAALGPLLSLCFSSDSPDSKADSKLSQMHVKASLENSKAYKCKLLSLL